MRVTARSLAAQINKLFKEKVVLLGSDATFTVDYLPTGLLPIDLLFQGGIPRGRFVVMTGAFSTLKSYIALKTIATTQKIGGQCALIDTERAFDPEWATLIGVDVNKLIVWPDPNSGTVHTGEEAIDVAQVLVLNKVDLIVFDSVAAALPQQEANKRLHKENIQPGRQAALMSAACRKLTASNSKTAIIWINQLREQIGVTFGPTERAPAGRALPFYASIIVNIRKAGTVTRDYQAFDGEKFLNRKAQVAQTFRALIEKSKLNRPYRETFFDFRLETPVGFDIPKFLFSQGVEYGLIIKRGSTWHYGETKAVGRDKFITMLAAQPAMQKKLETSLRKIHDMPLPRLLGRSVPAKKSAAVSSPKSSGAKAPARTPTRGRATSSATAAPRTTSSKSSTRRKFIH